MRRVFLSVAESSADMHAAALVRAAREHVPGTGFFGLTGPRSVAAGVESIGDLTAHAAMLGGAAGLLGRALAMRRRVLEAWQAQRPELVVLLDSPEFHLPLAADARRAGLRVLYYIAPQTWASREWRNRRIAACVHRLACILPFEEEYFRSRGIAAEYVGHPLFESLREEAPDAARVSALRGAGRPVIAVLPGSRGHVIDAVLPVQLEVLRRMRSAGRAFAAWVSCADERHRPRIERIIAGGGTEAGIEEAGNATLLTACDLALVASGTMTLHVAHYRKPMVVVYDAGGLLRPLHRVLGAPLLTTPHLSLVNILAGARVVPEFMPYVEDAGAVARVAGELLGDAAWRRLMIGQIDAVVGPLESSQASGNVCRIIAEELGVARRGAGGRDGRR